MKNILSILLLLVVSSCARVENLGYIQQRTDHPQTGITISIPSTIANAQWSRDLDTIRLTDERYTLTLGDTLSIEGEFRYKTPEGFIYFERRDDIKNGWTVYRQSNLARYENEDVEKPMLVVDCTWSHHTDGKEDKTLLIKGVFRKVK